MDAPVFSSRAEVEEVADIQWSSEPRPIRLVGNLSIEDKKKRFDLLGRGILHNSHRNVEVIRTRGTSDEILLVPPNVTV